MLDRRDEEQAKLFSRRAALLAVGQVGLLGTLIGRLYYLQVVEAERYSTKADENRVSTRLVAPERGHVLDRFGVPLAVNQQNFHVMVTSEQVGDLDRTLAALAKVIPLSLTDRDRIMRAVRERRGVMPVTIRENLSWEEMTAIQLNAPDLPGIAIERGFGRYYPWGGELAHVLGYVGTPAVTEVGDNPLLQLPGFQIGKAGIEKSFDMPLRGQKGSSQVEVNALGRVIRELNRDDGVPGSDVTLTIDIRLQDAALRALGTETGACVVMDCQTGEVLAMASSPGYDPNQFVRGVTQEQWKSLLDNPHTPLNSRTHASQYAPGSTFKPMVALAALAQKVITPEQTVFCSGAMDFGNGTFHCWKKTGHGAMDMVNGLKNSCDVYFYDLARRLGSDGVDHIAAMSRRFGLGTATAIGLPGERAGLIPTKAWKQATQNDNWHEGETLSVAIGQGSVLVTPLQLATMTARLANGGLAVKPILTKQELQGDDLQERSPVEPESLGLNPLHMKLVQRGMWEVINGTLGTAWRSKLPAELGVEMAGKTGSAQVRRISAEERLTGVIKNEDLPWKQRDNALFICYAPFDKPRYAIAVVVEHGGGGAAVAAPIGRAVMIKALTLDPARKTPTSRPSVPITPPDPTVLPPAVDLDTATPGGD